MAKKSSALKVSAKKAVTSTAKSSSKPVAKAKASPKESAKPALKGKASAPPPAVKAKGKAAEAPAKSVKAVSSKAAPVKEAPVAKAGPSAKATASAKGAKESAKATAAPAPAAKIDKSNMTEDQVRWHEMLKKYGKEQAQIYSMSGQFNASSPLMHKTLGWGYILTNDMDRLEVLFESGKKILISNYKPS